MKVYGYERTDEDIEKIAELIGSLKEFGIEIIEEEINRHDIKFEDRSREEVSCARINVADIPKNVKTIEFMYIY